MCGYHRSAQERIFLFHRPIINLSFACVAWPKPVNTFKVKGVVYLISVNLIATILLHQKTISPLQMSLPYHSIPPLQCVLQDFFLSPLQENYLRLRGFVLLSCPLLLDSGLLIRNLLEKKCA